MRPDEHLQQAAVLYRHGCSADAIADELLHAESSALSDDEGAWAAPVLRRAAAHAAREGSFDRARALLERSLHVRDVSPLARVDTLIELGRVEAASGHADAARRWEDAEDRVHELAEGQRIRALTDLGEAAYGAGLVDNARRHFAVAFELADAAVPHAPGVDHAATDDATLARIIAGLSTSSLLTGRRHREVARMLHELTVSPPAHPSVPTRVLMASAAGEVALGVDRPASVVRDLVDGALGDVPLPATTQRPAIESVSAALSLTGRPESAVTLLDDRLRIAAADHDTIAHVSLLPLRAHAHLLLGHLDLAVDDARAALGLIETHPSASGLAEAPTRYVLASASLELDDLDAAVRAVSVHDHRSRWAGTPMHGWYLDAVARVHARMHHHEEAIRAWTEAGREFTLVGGTGSVCEWRDGLARSLAAVGEHDAAVRAADEHMAAATRFGDDRMLAIARGTCAAVEPDHLRAAALLGTALRELPDGSGVLVRCRLGWERGARLRRAGRRRSARDQLASTLAQSTRIGAIHLSRLVDTEIVAAGGSTVTRSEDGRLALSVAERETAELAAEGLSNVEIARRRSVSRKTVEAQLSSLYRKLGIPDRRQIADALAD